MPKTITAAFTQNAISSTSTYPTETIPDATSPSADGRTRRQVLTQHVIRKRRHVQRSTIVEHCAAPLSFRTMKR
jgi:hypothetical protein